MTLSKESVYPLPCDHGQLWERKSDGAKFSIDYTIQPEARVRYHESGWHGYVHLSKFKDSDGPYRKLKEPDYTLGDFVYCRSHVAPHLSGWCTVSVVDKIGLEATTPEEAFEEVKAMGLPIYNHCDICYKFIANEPWMRECLPSGKVRLTCPEHDDE
jgi:hypothetical protein